MNKLITCILGQDCQNTISMCLESVKDSDLIIYVDGGSKDNTLKLVKDFAIENNKTDGKVIIKEKLFNKENPNAISDQRNFYLNYIKEEFMGDICLVLDADEVVDNLQPFLELRGKDNNFVSSPRMRHLMYTLGFEDATQETHFVMNRVFKIYKDLFYPQGEHTVLKWSGDKIEGLATKGLIWHLGYLGGVWDVKKRYDQQSLRNNGHSLEFLKDWNKKHMLGLYPIKQVNLDDLPNVILNNFGLSEEEVYFNYRKTVEPKHFVFIKQWNEFFKPKIVADFGCGVGLYLYAWEMTGALCTGFEYSKYAREHRICSSPIIDIDLNKKQDILFTYDLVTALDVLEHLKYETIDEAVKTLIKKSNKYILTSIPYKGTHNCDADKTHIIKEDRDWWVKQFTDKGLKEVEVPSHWIFKEQLLIFQK